MELELKLAMSPEDLATAKELPWLKEYQSAPTRTQHLKATYFDTPSFDLRQAGLTLRVRKEGRQHVQCLKGHASGTAMLAREEIESIVPSTQPDLEQLRRTTLAEQVEAKTWVALRPVFTTDIKRTIRQLRIDQTLVELSFDQGTVKSDKAEAPICETEIELIAGEASALLDFSQRLVEAMPCHLSQHGKADAGYALLGQAPSSGWQRAEPLHLDTDCSCEEALLSISRNTLRHLRANESAVRQHQQPEGIHQMRVAVRRLRSLLSLYKPLLPAAQRQALNDELRWLGQSLGPARDWDVFLSDTCKDVCQALEDPALAALRQLAEHVRAGAYDQALEAINSKRYTLLLLRLATWQEQRGWRQQLLSEAGARLFAPAREFASELLDRRLRRLQKRGKGFKKLPALKRHDLRINAKKLRYAAEFFASLYEQEDAGIYIKRLAKLQDDLGRYNDVIVARELLDRLIASAPPPAREDVTFAAGLVVGWQSHLHSDLKKQQEKRWRQLKKTDTFW